MSTGEGPVRLSRSVLLHLNASDSNAETGFFSRIGMAWERFVIAFQLWALELGLWATSGRTFLR